VYKPQVGQPRSKTTRRHNSRLFTHSLIHSARPSPNYDLVHPSRLSVHAYLPSRSRVTRSTVHGRSLRTARGDPRTASTARLFGDDGCPAAVNCRLVESSTTVWRTATRPGEQAPPAAGMCDNAFNFYDSRLVAAARRSSVCSYLLYY